MSAHPPGRPIIVSSGDPAGIGPELICEAWAARAVHKLPPFAVVANVALLEAAAQARGIDVQVIAISHPREAADCFTRGLPVIGIGACAYTPGVSTPQGAAFALASLDRSTQLAREGQAGALVTAPVAKSALAQIGFAFPGQTEFLAAACGLAPHDAVMMLAGPNLRTVPLTVHCALSEVPARLSAGMICHKARIVDAALRRDFGIALPRLAVAALNPHAGEQGAFGDEEARIIAPALAALQAEGLAVSGPHPADALFTPRARMAYDAALCMYHDQALIPLKALDFDEGVNVTLGLPIIRTSPDHGTAFDIAGKGIANPGAMIAAILLAGEMAARRARL